MARSSTGSEVVIVDRDAIATSSQIIPTVANLNVTKSSGVHVGPKFVSVTQNVHNSEVIKDLPLPKYLWSLAKSTTRAERLTCGVVVMALVLCVSLIVYFTVFAPDSEPEVIDIAPHEWFITREMWLADEFTHSSITEEFSPLRLVVIQHTVSTECTTHVNCVAAMKNLQKYFIEHLEYDIPYNFLVGNDDRVYEGRGWGIIGAHTLGYNSCSVGIGFIGDYREEIPGGTRVTELQQKNVQKLLEEGVRLGYLRPDFHVLGGKDLRDTLSPGTNLYNAIREWPQYDHENHYRGKTCYEISGVYNTTTVATTIVTDDTTTD